MKSPNSLFCAFINKPLLHVCLAGQRSKAIHSGLCFCNHGYFIHSNQGIEIMIITVWNMKIDPLGSPAGAGLQPVPRSTDRYKYIRDFSATAAHRNDNSAWLRGSGKYGGAAAILSLLNQCRGCHFEDGHRLRNLFLHHVPSASSRQLPA
jgi:hypothetical protein